jgi:uncharacterized protein (TIGR03435 family)
MRLLRVILFGFAFAPPVFSQGFEIASIKPGSPDVRESLNTQPNGRFVATSVTLRMLIGYAYSVREISGGPNWIASDRWTIEAKAQDDLTFPAGPPEFGKPTPLGVALQSLLAERFALKVHRETKDVPAYALIVDKAGLKLTAVDPPPQPTPGPPPAAPPPPRPGPDGRLPANFMPRPGGIMAGPGVILASGVSMTQIANVLTGRVGRPVVDKTDLKGYFNLRLEFAPEPAPGAPAAAGDPAGASIFTAIQEQLGLKLESTKVPMDEIVIDSVQRPSEN